MSLKVGEKQAGGKRKGYTWKKGTYMARLVRIYDLGLQPQEDYETKAAKPSSTEVMWTFEFPNNVFEIEKDGEKKMLPAWLSKTIRNSYNEKSTLTAWLGALDPEGSVEEQSELLSRGCMVSVDFTATGNAKITSVVSAPDGVPIGELVNEPGAFDLDDPDPVLFDALPQWVQDKILSAENIMDTQFGRLRAENGDDVDDSTPF